MSDTYDFYKAALEERKQEILRELESTYKTKQVCGTEQADKRYPQRHLGLKKMEMTTCVFPYFHVSFFCQFK